MKLINIALLCVGFLTSYSQGMSSEDLFKYALKNSPTIKNSNLDVDMADQQIKQARLSACVQKKQGVDVIKKQKTKHQM